MKIKEINIRPKKMFASYLNAAKYDAKNFFKNKKSWKKSKCIFCNYPKTTFAFKKCGFNYEKCNSCKSLFNNPRPSKKDLNFFYKKGKSVAFWSKRFYNETIEARKKLIYNPRAKEIKKILRKNKLKNALICDIGCGKGYLLDELRKMKVSEKLFGIEPSPLLAAECLNKGFKIFNCSLENAKKIEKKFDIAISFEVFEHLHSPLRFLKGCRKILKKNGLLFFTTLSSSGFDLCLLGKNSDTIHPPHHLNFASTAGFYLCAKAAQFEIEEFSTPGVLDLDIVKNKLRTTKIFSLDLFERLILKNRNQKLAQSFQSWIQKKQLSSHVHVLLRRC